MTRINLTLGYSSGRGYSEARDGHTGLGVAENIGRQEFLTSLRGHIHAQVIRARLPNQERKANGVYESSIVFGGANLNLTAPLVLRWQLIKNPGITHQILSTFHP